MVTGIDHIGIFVTDIDAAIRFYAETFGLTAGPIEVREDPPIRRACVRIGETELELIESSQPERTMLRLMPHQIPGIYHIGLRVDDVDQAAEALRNKNVPLVDSVRDGEQMRIQFVHPSAAQGTMIELVTRKS